jgi:N-hydroxyarylamine O-acetyltransferase
MYLTDVGFGDSFRRPISFDKMTTTDVSGKYRIVHYEAPHHRSGQESKIQENYEYYILEHSTGKHWKPQYKFHYKRKLDLEEYQDNCDWIESSPDSGFTQGKTWSIAKKDGRVSLSENGITVTHYLQQTKIKYDHEKDFEYYLKENI